MGDQMKRRELLLLGAMMAMTGPLRAQKAMPVIGFLGGTSPGAPSVRLSLAAFRKGLGETGFVEGQNLIIEFRWAEGRHDRLPALAVELVRREVNVIATDGGTPSAMAAKAATSSIPIVFTGVSDPVGAGLVTSLARPGRNLTGFSNITIELIPKLVELLSELVPEAQVIAVLVNPANKAFQGFVSDLQEAARAKRLQLLIMRASTADEIDGAFATIIQGQGGALIIGGDPFFYSRQDQLVHLASRYGVPAIYNRPEYISAGGLISYGPSFTATFHQLGVYAGKLLHGADPAELPVQLPTKFELIINLTTAKALGLTVPQSLLARADEVIE